MVYPQVVQDQVDLTVRVLDEPAQKVDQDVRVERAVEGLPTHMPLVGDSGDNRQTVALAVYPYDRGLALGA